MQDRDEPDCIHGTDSKQTWCGTNRGESQSHSRDKGSHQCRRTAKFSGPCQFQRTVPARFRDDCGTTQEVDSQGTDWQWGKEENEAFEALKNQLANALMMAFYDKEASAEVVTGASPVGLGGILVQEKQGVKRAVAFASRSLSDVERRYSQTEKEALAVVWACERFHLYLTGLQSFQLVTVCKALEAIYGPRSKPSARVERWVLRLMPFKYTVRHVPSGQNIADCLSRLTKIPASPHDGVTEEYVRMVAVNATPRAITTREIERESAEDEELTEVRCCWKTGDWSAAPSPYRLLCDEITVVGRLVMRGMRIVIPVSLRKRVLIKVTRELRRQRIVYEAKYGGRT